MKRFLLAAGMAILALATPAGAFDIATMSDDERATFRAEIRAYLMDNPEVLLEAIAVLEDRQAAEQQLSDGQLVIANADDIFNDGISWVGGNPDGDITVVEFSDYSCPYCKRVHPVIDDLVSSDGNIRLIYKEFPILGPNSEAASRFALATLLVAGPDAYRKVNNALMSLRGKPVPDAFPGIAEKLGLDADAILAKTDSDAVSDIIGNNQSLGQRLRISGTPTFIFGGQIVRGVAPIESMRAIVKAEREK
jgi:protein-disulfide isomerase